MEQITSDHDKYQRFFDNPDKYLPINETGDLYLEWFRQRYVALRLLRNLPIFKRAYKMLTDRKNFSRANSFGEMHCDGYLWIIRHPEKKIMVEERQSYKYIYIYDEYHFHIRELAYKYAYPAYMKSKLKNVTLRNFRKQNFEPSCDTADRFNAFSYGDGRDNAYILSADFFLKGKEKASYVNSHSIGAIESMKYWEYYLDNPGELE